MLEVHCNHLPDLIQCMEFVVAPTMIDQYPLDHLISRFTNLRQFIGLDKITSLIGLRLC